MLVDLLNITFIGLYLEREKYFLSAFHVVELLPWFQMLSLQYCAFVASTCCTLEKGVFCCLWTSVQYFFFEKAEDNCEVVAVCKFQSVYVCVYIYIYKKQNKWKWMCMYCSCRQKYFKGGSMKSLSQATHHQIEVSVGSSICIGQVTFDSVATN